MRSISSNRIQLQIIGLLLSLLAILLVLAVVHSSFTANVARIENQLRNQSAKQDVGMSIYYRLYAAETLVFKLSGLNNRRELQTVKKRFDDNLLIIQNGLSVLQDGGYFEDRIATNIPGKNAMYLSAHYLKPDYELFALEVLELGPALYDMDEQVQLFTQLIESRLEEVGSHHEQSNGRERNFLKAIDATLQRSQENAARILHDSQLEMESLSLRLEQAEKHHDYFQFPVIALSIGLAVLILIMNLVRINKAILKRDEAEEQLEHIAHFDALTGLPNRVLLADRLHQAMSQALRRKQQLAVAFIDLDGFKEINDHFGHEAGDQLLVALAKRMKDGLREGDTLSRIGGDEFVAVITDLGVVEDCLPMLNRLLASAAEPVIFSGTKLQVSASLGVTFYPQLEAIDADQLQRQADQAMYQAKQSGKNRYHIFDAELDRSVRGHHETLERIRHALLAEEFRLYYQPKVNMHSGKFVGAEALIRWQHPDQGLLLPAVFLPVVEDHELAVDIDEWVIKTAILQMEAWQQEGHDIPISVNIGARLLQKSVFVQWLQSILEKHPLVKPGNLRLEVLETSALEDIAQVSQVIEACAQMGVLFALDDFGTGYSSLTYLKRLAVAELKIDQTFVRDMLEDPDDLAILEGVIGLAEAFHRDVIAEGVETIEHGRMLLQLGCELAQGYGIARPMPVDQLSVWAASWKAPESWTNCNKIKHEDQPLLYAIVEHRAWIENLKRYFEGLQDTPPQMNYHQCRFGIMMEHVKQNGASLKNLLDPIDPLHQKVHRLATELCELKASGNSIGAQERLGELYDLRNELTDKIEDVLASRYRDFH